MLNGPLTSTTAVKRISTIFKYLRPWKLLKQFFIPLIVKFPSFIVNFHKANKKMPLKKKSQRKTSLFNSSLYVDALYSLFPFSILLPLYFFRFFLSSYILSQKPFILCQRKKHKKNSFFSGH